MKLISMTDFVLQQDKLMRHQLNDPITFTMKVTDYALFLKKPITLGMFVPCDDEGNVLEEPFIDKITAETEFIPELVKYAKAKLNVVFNRFYVKAENDNWHFVTVDIEEPIVFRRFGSNNLFTKSHNYQTIEDLIGFNLDLAVSF